MACGESKALWGKQRHSAGEFEKKESSTTCTGKRWESPWIEKILHDLLGIKNGENHTLLEIYQKHLRPLGKSRETSATLWGFPGKWVKSTQALMGKQRSYPYSFEE